MRPRNLKFFLYINTYGYYLQIKFHVPRSHTFWEKSDDNLNLSSHFSPILCDRRTWNFFCIITHMDTPCKPHFMFSVAHVSRKMRWCLEISIALFSDTVWPRNLKFFLYINPYGYSLQTKFHVPLSHNFREKCDDNLQKFKVAQLS